MEIKLAPHPFQLHNQRTEDLIGSRDYASLRFGPKRSFWAKLGQMTLKHPFLKNTFFIFPSIYTLEYNYLTKYGQN